MIAASLNASGGQGHVAAAPHVLSARAPSTPRERTCPLCAKPIRTGQRLEQLLGTTVHAHCATSTTHDSRPDRKVRNDSWAVGVRISP